LQDKLVKEIRQAIESPAIPADILTTLLNLAEYMEHSEKALLADYKVLGEYAAKCQAYAKALHYKELEFHQAPSADILESIISINNQLQQPDAANGALIYSQQHHKAELKESWYEKLGRWEDALAAYERRCQEGADETVLFDNTLGQLRCLHALGEWDKLSSLAQTMWRTANEDRRNLIAPFGATASWGVNNWEMLEAYLGVMPDQSYDAYFFHAILCLHKNLFAKGQKFIDLARDSIVAELTALAGESYNRAYKYDASLFGSF
jgi:FKBP12-rapamycin complex-associated protein